MAYGTVHRKGNGESLNGTVLQFCMAVRALRVTIHPKR